MVNAPPADLLISSVAAACMDQNAIQTGYQTNIVGTGTANRAQITLNAVKILIDSQHTGDAALFQNFIDYVGLTVARLGQSLLQVIEHDHDRTLAADIGLGGLAGQGIDLGPVNGRNFLLHGFLCRSGSVGGSQSSLVGAGILFRSFCRLFVNDIGALFRLFLCSAAAADQREDHGQSQEHTNQSFHIFSLHSFRGYSGRSTSLGVL